MAAKKTSAAKRAATATAKVTSTAQSAKQGTVNSSSRGKKTTASPRSTSAGKARKTVTDTIAPKAVSPRSLKVRDDESPWTAKELDEVRAELTADIERITHELDGFEADLAGLIKDSGDGAGDDQADTGAKNFEREHEYSLAQNSRGLVEQSLHALERIEDGSYGICEQCGEAIGKLRLQAFPRASLCLSCKAKQERR